MDALWYEFHCTAVVSQGIPSFGMVCLVRSEMVKEENRLLIMAKWSQTQGGGVWGNIAPFIRPTKIIAGQKDPLGAAEVLWPGEIT